MLVERVGQFSDRNLARATAAMETGLLQSGLVYLVSVQCMLLLWEADGQAVPEGSGWRVWLAGTHCTKRNPGQADLTPTSTCALADVLTKSAAKAYSRPLDGGDRPPSRTGCCAGRRPA